SSRRRHTSFSRDWSSDVCSSDLIAADELLLELERIELTLDEAARRAGQGCDPEFERRLGAHLRSLRGMLDPDHVPVVADAMEAAERAMNAADPQAPLMMLRLRRD